MFNLFKKAPAKEMVKKPDFEKQLDELTNNLLKKNEELLKKIER